jgi:UDP-N-acetylmuramyl pentapeptide phosphotransferase/UDP-N-acetylglucosamine-1-phosphate transferase
MPIPASLPRTVLTVPISPTLIACFRIGFAIALLLVVYRHAHWSVFVCLTLSLARFEIEDFLKLRKRQREFDSFMAEISGKNKQSQAERVQ